MLSVSSPAGWTPQAGITISILDKGTSHKKPAVVQEDSCTLCFHSIPAASQKASGKIKGRSTGTLTRFSFLLSFALFKDEKGS